MCQKSNKIPQNIMSCEAHWGLSSLKISHSESKLLQQRGSLGFWDRPHNSKPTTNHWVLWVTRMALVNMSKTSFTSLPTTNIYSLAEQIWSQMIWFFCSTHWFQGIKLFGKGCSKDQGAWYGRQTACLK